MKREDDQALWDLLGKAKEPALSPFFARNVVRQIRQEKRWSEYVFGWFNPRKLIPASAVGVAMMVAALSVHLPVPDSSPDNPPDTLASIDPQDYDTVADLDDLLTSDDDSLWNENDTPSL